MARISRSKLSLDEIINDCKQKGYFVRISISEGGRLNYTGSVRASMLRASLNKNNTDQVSLKDYLYGSETAVRQFLEKKELEAKQIDKIIAGMVGLEDLNDDDLVEMTKTEESQQAAKSKTQKTPLTSTDVVNMLEGGMPTRPATTRTETKAKAGTRTPGNAKQTLYQKFQDAREQDKTLNVSGLKVDGDNYSGASIQAKKPDSATLKTVAERVVYNSSKDTAIAAVKQVLEILSKQAEGSDQAMFESALNNFGVQESPAVTTVKPAVKTPVAAAKKKPVLKPVQSSSETDDEDDDVPPPQSRRGRPPVQKKPARK